MPPRLHQHQLSTRVSSARAVDHVAPATVQVGEQLVAVSPAAHAADTRIDDIGEKLTNMINMLGPYNVQLTNMCECIASFGRRLGISLPFLGCQPDALFGACCGVASRRRVESANCVPDFFQCLRAERVDLRYG